MSLGGYGVAFPGPCPITGPGVVRVNIRLAKRCRFGRFSGEPVLGIRIPAGRQPGQGRCRWMDLAGGAGPVSCTASNAITRTM
ncbi:hypothetical protein LX15_005030 [Streptoalloteichus tenebrarius]|uniref:Uncharacterized protein n=1 Tax=Streptoalloteichus tenebrarius (strain ATCC 17920 / DSM 40477 / JCM 4838 / CBS 697.72 / NBRC 16177 / NCIMB 11028 / NRRL B-12390 / A12253. 1 / ISP 5477) TaxID=1933 RepID=A0ABT1I0M1_STRSD|nr:hypothetical protein [Streptoalloteichus tenebrarius]